MPPSERIPWNITSLPNGAQMDRYLDLERQLAESERAFTKSARELFRDKEHDLAERFGLLARAIRALRSEVVQTATEEDMAV